jgi:flagellar motility protein MotE (MotC chaperone)
MIVTRQRKKKFPWKRVLIVLVAIALVAGAFWWTPSRNWIAATPPAKPIVQLFDPVGKQQQIQAQSAQIAELQRQLASVQSQIADRDKQISQLQTQVNDAQEQAAVASAAPKAKPAPQASGAPESANDLSAQGTSDMRRTAQVWGSMDSEAAAKVVQRLPVEYVVRIFALMSPDSVGAILENLPAPYAARLTQEHPELKR